MIKRFLEIVFGRKMSAEEEYYSKSTDLVDLERRQKNVSRGTAPFQNPYSTFLSYTKNFK